MAWGTTDLVLRGHFLLPFLKSENPESAASELRARWNVDGAPSLQPTAAAPASQPILGGWCIVLEHFKAHCGCWHLSPLRSGKEGN